MSAATADYGSLLQTAVEQAKANAPRATDDLLRFSSQAAVAVAGVTKGAAALELVPVNPGSGDIRTYQLQFRRVGSDAPPSDLGVYQIPPTGYPVFRWPSWGAWERSPDNAPNQHLNVGELDAHFRWLLSDADSRLVVLVAFIQQYTLQTKAG
jgi:hypothetical protein